MKVFPLCRKASGLQNSRPGRLRLTGAFAFGGRPSVSYVEESAECKASATLTLEAHFFLEGFEAVVDDGAVAGAVD
jgi:hypothetical protein